MRNVIRVSGGEKVESNSQFVLKMKTKDMLDKFKAENKSDIIAHFKPARRAVTNDMAVQYLLLKYRRER